MNKETEEVRLLRRIEKCAEELWKRIDDSEYTIYKMSDLARVHGMPHEVSYREAHKKLHKLLDLYLEKFYK